MSESRKYKISFIGDLMCENPLLKAARQENGSYDFRPVFSQVKDKFNASDYVVGNLETVCAGEEAGYTDHIYSFNSPDSFIEAISEAGIDMVTTANNHCLDRGLEGLRRTGALLREHKIEPVGTCNMPEQKDKTAFKSFNGIRVAFIAYTYGTNLQINNVLLGDDELGAVNLLQPQSAGYAPQKRSGFKKWLFGLILKVISIEQWIGLKKKLGFRYNSPTVDDNLQNLDDMYLERLKSDLEKAGAVSDFVIVCLHSGGQFNEEPGQFSKHIMKLLCEYKADLVVGAHPHVVQKFELVEGKMPGFYSLGSFSISPGSLYLIADHLPEYSIMPHLYLRGDKQKVLDKLTFTILKAVDDEKGLLQVWPVYDLEQRLNDEEKEQLKKDVTLIYNRLTGTGEDAVDIVDEYLLIDNNF